MSQTSIPCNKCVGLASQYSTIIRVRIAQGSSERRISSLRVKATAPAQQLQLTSPDSKLKLNEVRLAPCKCCSASFFTQLMQRTFLDSSYLLLDVEFGDRCVGQAELLVMGKAQALLRVNMSAPGEYFPLNYKSAFTHFQRRQH